MTAFERAEEIAASIDHKHQGPNDPCLIRDAIMSAIHEEKAELSKKLETATALNNVLVQQSHEIIQERDGALLQVELWKKYATLISQEFRETVDFAILHGWVSSRVEAGKELRAKLGIGDGWSEKKNEPVDACTTEGRPMNEMIPPIGGETRIELPKGCGHCWHPNDTTAGAFKCCLCPSFSDHDPLFPGPH